MVVFWQKKKKTINFTNKELKIVRNKIQYFIKIISLHLIKKLKFSRFLSYFNELFILF